MHTRTRIGQDKDRAGHALAGSREPIQRGAKVGGEVFRVKGAQLIDVRELPQSATGQAPQENIHYRGEAATNARSTPSRSFQDIGRERETYKVLPRGSFRIDRRTSSGLDSRIWSTRDADTPVCRANPSTVRKSHWASCSAAIMRASSPRLARRTIRATCSFLGIERDAVDAMMMPPSPMCLHKYSARKVLSIGYFVAIECV